MEKEKILKKFLAFLKSLYVSKKVYAAGAVITTLAVAGGGVYFFNNIKKSADFAENTASNSSQNQDEVNEENSETSQLAESGDSQTTGDGNQQGIPTGDNAAITTSGATQDDMTGNGGVAGTGGSSGNLTDEQIQEIVSGSMIRGDIDIETLIVKKEEEKDTNVVSNGVQSGFDSYTPTQNAGNTSGSNNVESASSSSSSNSNNESNHNNVNESQDIQIANIDKSSLNGRDVSISEGEPFNPMNILQLAAIDVDGKNITNKIDVIENNVDIYTPGTYNVKANVELSNGSKLEKSFSVKVEPTVLNLTVSGITTSKEVVQKDETFKMTFNVSSSKSYLDVVSANINNIEYKVSKVSEGGLFRRYNKYEVEVKASNKAGIEELKVINLTMSDGTVVDVNKTTSIQVLKKDVSISNVEVKNESDKTNRKIELTFEIIDIDNLVSDTKAYILDENNNVVSEKQVEKNKFETHTFDVSNDGTYIVKVVGNKVTEKYNNEFVDNTVEEVELFSTSIEVALNDIAYIEEASEENLQVARVASYSNDENVEVESEAYSLERSSGNVSGSDDKEYTHEVKITGNVANDKGDFLPGTLQVTVPTATHFKVDKDGSFSSPTMTVTNKGTQNIDVFVDKFIDTNGTNGINVQSKSTVTSTTDQVKRSNISLNLGGNHGTAYLGSVETGTSKSGVYTDENLGSETTTGIKVSTISSGQNDNLRLNGEVGKDLKGINQAIQDTFTLILRIKKSETN